MKTGRCDEDGDDHQHPPDECQDGERDGGVADQADGEEVVGGHGWVVGGEVRAVGGVVGGVGCAVDAVGEEAGVFVCCGGVVVLFGGVAPVRGPNAVCGHGER